MPSQPSLDPEPDALGDEETIETKFKQQAKAIYFTNKRILAVQVRQGTQTGTQRSEKTTSRYYDTIQEVKTTSVASETPSLGEVFTGAFFLCIGLGVFLPDSMTGATATTAIGAGIGIIGLLVMHSAYQTDTGQSSLKMRFSEESVWTYRFPEDSNTPTKIATEITKQKRK